MSLNLIPPIRCEVAAQGSSTYTEKQVYAAITKLGPRTDPEAMQQREFLKGLIVKHGWTP